MLLEDSTGNEDDGPVLVHCADLLDVELREL
jgi:hypothetical protein